MHDDDTPFREPVPTFERPTLLNGCARAATAAEARFRVTYPNARGRSTRVIALDAGAARIMEGVRGGPWTAARFLRLAPRQPDISPAEVILLSLDGTEVRLTAELPGADLVVMVATSPHGRREAEIVGRLAREAAVMTAGLVLSDGDADEVVCAMRPTASVLVVTPDDDALPALLSALRA